MRSPSVSISATSTPSSEVPLIRPMAVRKLMACVSIPGKTCYTSALITPNNIPYHTDDSNGLQVRFSARTRGPRIYPSGIRARDIGRAREGRKHHRLYRLRLHGTLAACRLAPADHDAAHHAKDRSQADLADGWRNDARRRSFGQGREPQDSYRPDHRREFEKHPRGVLEIS